MCLYMPRACRVCLGAAAVQESVRRHYSALKPFVIISFSYLLFTTTDGAVRMIVLLHAYTAGFTAWEVRGRGRRRRGRWSVMACICICYRW